jgi:hypothetical protein
MASSTLKIRTDHVCVQVQPCVVFESNPKGSRYMIKLPAALIALIAFQNSLKAQGSFTDPVTGFGITVRAPFTVEPTSRRQFDVGIGVKSSTGLPPLVGTGQYVCEAGFKAASQNNDLTRTEINAFVQKPEWRKVARAVIELGFTVTSERTFMLSGFRGIEYHARPKFGPGAEEVRGLVSMVETSRGRTTVLCLTDRRAFQRSLATFRSLRSAVIIPQ